MKKATVLAWFANRGDEVEAYVPDDAEQHKLPGYFDIEKALLPQESVTAFVAQNNLEFGGIAPMTFDGYNLRCNGELQTPERFEVDGQTILLWVIDCGWIIR